MNKQDQQKDKGLDTPAESNRDNINFMETEETSSNNENQSGEGKLTTGSAQDSADDYGEISRKTKE